MRMMTEVTTDLAQIIHEYQTLKSRNASEEEFIAWRERVKERFPYESNRLLVQVREILEAKASKRRAS